MINGFPILGARILGDKYNGVGIILSEPLWFFISGTIGSVLGAELALRAVVFISDFVLLFSMYIL